MLRFSTYQIEEFNINHLRIALYNYITSIQRKDGFVIRIDDLEQANSESKNGEILDILKKFSIKDEQVVYQSKNMNIYQQFAYRLLKEKKAFACFCKSDDKCNCEQLSSKEIQKLKEQDSKFVIKIKKADETFNFVDIIQGKQEQKFNELDSFIILNDNGIPTYNFACAIDDMSMNVTTIIRDESFLNNTHKQLYIQHLLGYNSNIEYAHIKSIKNIISIKSLFEEGFLPDAIINYLILIGKERENEIFYLPDAIEWFDISKIRKESIEFDIEKLKEINRKHLLRMDSKKLSQLFGFSDSDIGELLKIFLENSSTINELEEQLELLFNVKVKPKEYRESMELLSKIILDAPMINSFDEFKVYLSKKSGLSGDKLLKPLAVLLIGRDDTSKLKTIYKLIKPYLLEVARCQ